MKTSLILKILSAAFLDLICTLPDSCHYEKVSYSLPVLETGFSDSEQFDELPIYDEGGDAVTNNFDIFTDNIDEESDVNIGDSSIKSLTNEIKDINTDTIGWIYIPDSNVNYPILYCEGDNEYYLSHDIYKNADSHGCIFLDQSSGGEFSDISIVSGHSMRDKSMFGHILNYKDQSWADLHQYIYIYDMVTVRKYKVFACILLNAENEGVRVKFDSMKERLDYFDEIKSRSKITPLDIENPLDVLVLNTCSYEADNFRCLVFATNISTN